MARIRTIKPEFFSHWALYEAERDTGLPLRVAFAGLWTQADREGRFRWVPQQLKLGCLPYDDLDFSRVLHALTTRGFIVHYRVNDTDFGAIPGFTRHQVINNRESPSTLPEPNEINTLTREPRVDDACTTPLKHAQGERKGKEGKGREGKGTLSVSSAIARNARVSDESVDEHFELFWNAYDKKRGRSDCEKVWKRINPDDRLAQQIVRAARTYAAATPEKAYRKDPVRWLTHKCWEDEVVNRQEQMSSYDKSIKAAGLAIFGNLENYQPSEKEVYDHEYSSTETRAIAGVMDKPPF